MDCLRTIIAAFLDGVRTDGTRGEPLYCVRDVAAKLGLTRGGAMASAWRLPDQDRTHRRVLSGRGMQTHLFVTANGFLRLAMAGRTAESREFRAKAAGLDLPGEFQPPEAALVTHSPPPEVLAIESAERREHALFWLAMTAAIARSPRRHETIAGIVAKNHARGGVSASNCYRYFRLWVDSGGDWRVFDRWAGLRKSPAK